MMPRLYAQNSTPEAKRIAEELCSEAVIAARPGQPDRLEALADRVEQALSDEADAGWETGVTDVIEWLRLMAKRSSLRMWDEYAAQIADAIEEHMLGGDA